MLSHRFTALYAHAVVWIVVGLLLSYLCEWIWFVYLLPIVVIDMWFAVCLCLMLRLPTRRVNNGPPEEWTWDEHLVAGYPVRWLSKSYTEGKPLALLIHGWNSRASNMIGRSKLYEKLGYNCILFEMRAHGGNKRVSNWAALHVCHDLEQVLRIFDSRGMLDNGFLIHGHSLGGFVAQRTMRDELVTSKKALGMILESPVTSYVYINNQTCEYLKIPTLLHGFMMYRLLKYYNRINEKIFTVDSIDQLSTPKWGFPSCPTLLVQAKHDQTLGTIHANLLIDVHSTRQSNFSYHIVEELKHSYESSNEKRDELIKNWMEENSLFFA